MECFLIAPTTAYHMEEEVTNDAQSGKEAQELQDGSDGLTAELQESQEDAANLKQARPDP